jgi:pyruvate/oxaloacetate carboxyltransferase
MALKGTSYDTGLDLALLAEIADDAREMREDIKTLKQT